MLGDRIESACAALDGSENMEPGRFVGWVEAGCLLAAALAPGPISAANLDAVATMQLRAVTINNTARSVTLLPAEVVDHALLSGWVRPTLGETFGQALRAGADLSHLGGVGPEAWGATVADDAVSRVGAEVAFRFPADVYVVALFGTDVSDAASITQRTLRHPAIFDIGAAAVDYSQPAEEGTPVAAVQVLIAQAEAIRAGGFIQ